jgi:putative photosynthetic complex assembly protein 2
MLYAVFLWWFSTGVVLLTVRGAGRGAHWLKIVGVSLLTVAALAGLAKSSTDVTPGGAVIAFTSAILLWGAQEIAFLSGLLTGPFTRRCPEGCSGWRRAAYATSTILYHEIALILSGAAVAVLTWSGDNRIGLWTFLILWTMRVSAKLNLFLGVPNLNDGLLPDHLRHLKSYFRQRPINALFVPVMAVATIVTVVLAALAVGSEAGTFAATGYSLLASLMALAVLEHGFMVIRMSINGLWNWSQGGRVVSAVPDEVVVSQDRSGLRPLSRKASTASGPGVRSR